jgi:hypothetical protein
MLFVLNVAFRFQNIQKSNPNKNRRIDEYILSKLLKANHRFDEWV